VVKERHPAVATLVKSLLTTRLGCTAAAIALLVCVAGCSGLPRPVAAAVLPLRSAPISADGGAIPSTRFGGLFCGVLGHLADFGADWGYCDRYFRPSGTPTPVPEAIEGAASYRLLVVPGIFGQCVEAIARPFEDARRHLASAHRLDVEYLSVSGLGSTAYNAAEIEAYLQQQLGGTDKRPYIAVGYSKGALDLIEAVSKHATARASVRALVTIAGSVLGSRLPEGVPRGLVDTLQGQRLGTCDVGDGGGIDSLRRADSVAVVAGFSPPAGFRSYSIAAVSDPATTSAVLASSWRQLTVYSLEQDSQVVHEDAIVPGGAYLGMARGDHWAVALPFEDIPPTDPLARVAARLVNRNHYPRVALFEAALRYVLMDLEAH
jgi:hypothetical protein